MLYSFSVNFPAWLLSNLDWLIILVQFSLWFFGSCCFFSSLPDDSCVHFSALFAVFFSLPDHLQQVTLCLHRWQRRHNKDDVNLCNKNHDCQWLLMTTSKMDCTAHTHTHTLSQFSSSHLTLFLCSSSFRFWVTGKVCYQNQTWPSCWPVWPTLLPCRSSWDRTTLAREEVRCQHSNKIKL